MIMCEWHKNCSNPAAGRISAPYGFLWGCKEAIKEYRAMYGIRTSVRFETSLTSEELRMIKLTSEEKQELAELPRDERDQVLRRLLASKRYKFRKSLS